MLHRPSQPAGRAQEAQAQEVPRPVPQLLHGTCYYP
jgi:hypothetical protein